MHLFLNKMAYREVKILQLLDSDEKWWLASDLAIKIQCSNKTLYSSLQSLQTRLSENWDESIQLKVNPNQGVYLERRYNFNIHLVYLSYLKESIFFKFCLASFNSKVMTIDSFAQEQFVSPSTLYKEINHFKRYLKYYDLSVSLKPFKITGSEKQKRYFFSNFFWQCYRASEWPFEQINKSDILPVVNEISSILQEDFSPINKENITQWLSVGLTRIINNERIKLSADVTEEIKRSPLYSKLMPTLVKMLKKQNIPEEHWKNEIAFFISILKSTPLFVMTSNLTNELYHYYKEENSIFYQESIKCIIALKKFFQIYDPLEFDKLLVINLVHAHYHSFHLIGDDQVFVDNKFFDAFHAYAPRFYRKFKDFTVYLQEKKVISNFILENKSYMFKQYLSIFYPFVNLDSHAPKIKILLLNSGSRIFNDKLASDIHQKLCQIASISVSSHSLTAAEADLVVTDIYLDNDSDTPILVWSSPPQRSDWDRLIEQIKILANKEKGP